MRNNGVNEYYRILKAIFPLQSYYEGKFIREFKTSLIEFSINNPNCTFDDLATEFGTPQEVLLEYMDAQDYLITSQKIRKQNFRNFFLF